MCTASSRIFSFFIARKVHKTEKYSRQEEPGMERLNAFEGSEMVHGDDNMKYDEENS